MKHRKHMDAEVQFLHTLKKKKLILKDVENIIIKTENGEFLITTGTNGLVISAPKGNVLAVPEANIVYVSQNIYNESSNAEEHFGYSYFEGE